MEENSIRRLRFNKIFRLNNKTCRKYCYPSDELVKQVSLSKSFNAMTGALGHLAKMHSLTRLNSIHTTPAWSLPLSPAIIHYWLHQKEKLALICENLWEALSQLESGYIPPPKDGNCLPRNIQAWRPLETRGNQASCCQQCNQCILWEISAYSEQVQPQIRSGWDETEDEYVEIKRAFEFGFSKMYVILSFHDPLIPLIIIVKLQYATYFRISFCRLSIL